MSKKEAAAGGQRKLRSEDVMICTSHSQFFESTNRKRKGRGHRRRMGRTEILTDFWGGNLKKRNHLESLGTDDVLGMWRVWVRRGGVYVLMGKPEGRRPLGRPRRRWVDNIRMDLQEVGCGYMNWIGLAQDRDRWRTLVSAVMNLRVP